MESRKTSICNKINELCENIKSDIISDYDYFIESSKKIIEHKEGLRTENDKLNNKILDLFRHIDDIKDNINKNNMPKTYIDMLRIMSNDNTFYAFVEFAKQRKCEENLLFWKDVKDMKMNYNNNNDKSQLCLDIKNIYINYISQNKLNINIELTSNIKKHINDNHYSINIYDTIVTEIETLIHNNLYKSFSETGIGKVCLSNINI